MVAEMNKSTILNDMPHYDDQSYPEIQAHNDQILQSRSSNPALFENFNSYCGQTALQDQYRRRKSQWLPFDDCALVGLPQTATVDRDQKVDYLLYDFVAYREKQRRFLYTVCEIKLRKEVPNIIFDSKSTSIIGFQNLIASSQILSANPQFDQYFRLYSPLFHSIETLSFVTPEVLEELLKLTAYDFELIGDSLIGYAPILNKEELIYFREACLKLHARLNDNLPFFNFSNTALDPFAQKLSLGSVRAIATLAGIFGVFFSLSLAATIASKQTGLSWLLILTIILGYCLTAFSWSTASALRSNKRLKQEFISGRLLKENKDGGFVKDSFIFLLVLPLIVVLIIIKIIKRIL